MSGVSVAARAALAPAIVGAVVLVLNGGWSGLIVGFAAGAGAAVVALGRVPWRTPGEAMRVAGVAGLAAGSVLLLTSLFHDAVLVGWAGLPTVAAGRLAPAAMGTFVVAVLAATVTGGIDALPVHLRTWARALFYGAFLIAYPYLDRALAVGWIGPLIAVLIFVLLGLGLNIVVGYAGLLDLG